MRKDGNLPRRHFLRNVAAAAAAPIAITHSPALGASVEEEIRPRSGSGRLQKAISIWAFPPDKPLRDSMKLARKAGFHGIELALAEEGRKVVALDVAPAMVNRIRQKAAAVGLSQAITARVLPAARLSELAHLGLFDGAYASFGVLNAEPDLSAVAAGLADVLPADTYFVTSIMSRICWWELAWFGLHLQPWRALRRWRHWAEASIGAGQMVPTQFYLPSSIAKCFSPAFRVERKMALPLLLPPPYLDHLYRRFKQLFGRLQPLEGALRGRFPFYAFGDHFLLVLRRV